MIFNPNNFLKLVFGRDFFKGKILNSEMEFKKTMLQSVIKATTLSEREVNASVYKVVDLYSKKIKELKAEGEKSYKKKAINNEVLLKNRLENLVLYNEVKKLKKEHEGQYYRWIPSSAEEPDPEHQLLYGKIFKVGEGDKDGNMPTERYGCRCGIEFLEDKKEVAELENMEDEEPKIPLEAEFEDIKFDNLKNTEESEEYAKKFIDENIKNKVFNGVSFKGIAIENQNKINETLTNIFEKYSITKLAGIKAIDPKSAIGKKAFTDSDALASYSPIYKGIFLNKEILKSPENIKKYFEKSKEAFTFLEKNRNKLTKQQLEILKRYEISQRSLVNESLEGIIIHELGHFVQWEVLPVKLNNALGTMENAEKISGYATFSKGEYIAESFSAYIKGEREYLNKDFIKLLDGLKK